MASVASIGVRARWLSVRALRWHLAVVLWVPGCLYAFNWQVHRALDGNGLSYLYSVEWPVLALVGIAVWWSMLHTDPESVGARAQQRAVEAAEREGAPQGSHAVRRREQEDETLAEYNDQLARLASQGPKGWRRR
jgi:hypothetical protein